MDSEISPSASAQLIHSDLKDVAAETVVIDFGAILLCKSGSATLLVNLEKWQLKAGSVITLFPNDLILIGETSSDFSVEMLRYDKAMLREASLQLEHTVYSLLRKDRCRTDKQIVTDIVDTMFALLRLYFSQPDCRCLDQLVLCQLKSFFVGFNDWLLRKETDAPQENGSQRMNELFNRFMKSLEDNYRQSHDVAFYASLLNITPKYLNTIVKQKTEHTAKVVIDHYVVLQLKIMLGKSNMSVKQLAWDFHFSDDSFFCRYFKRHTGLTPQQFRMSLRHK